MKRLLIATALAAGLGLTAGAGAASAADGCGYDYSSGSYYCYPGARPGVPYYDGDPRAYGRRYDDRPYYGHRYQRDYDPGAAVALGIIGGIGSAIISQQRYKGRRTKHRR